MATENDHRAWSDFSFCPYRSNGTFGYLKFKSLAWGQFAQAFCACKVLKHRNGQANFERRFLGKPFKLRTFWTTSLEAISFRCRRLLCKRLLCERLQSKVTKTLLDLFGTHTPKMDDAWKLKTRKVVCSLWCFKNQLFIVKYFTFFLFGSSLKRARI